MPRTKASGVGGGEAFFDRILHTRVDGVWNASLSFVANRAVASVIEVPHVCTVQAIGVNVANAVNGNIQLGLYDSNWVRQCVTGVVAVAGLAAGYNWLVTTTNPTLQPGIYWLAQVCDTAYVAAVSGINWHRSGTCRNIEDSADLGNQMMVRMDAAYPLPDPFVPVNNSNDIVMAIGMRVTP